MITTIEIYTFSIRRKRAHSPISFSDEPDIFNLLIDDQNGFVPFIDKCATGDLPAEKMSIRIPKGKHHRNIDERFLCGIIETGHYGKEYEAVDKDNPKDDTKKIVLGKSKAILKPFFYFIKIPRNGNKALLILERTENDGIYPVFRSIFISFFNMRLNIGFDEDETCQYTIDRYNFILGSYIKKLTEGRFNTYTLTANSISKDAAERYFGSFEQNDFSIELVMKFNKNLSSDKEKKIRELINSGNTLFDSQDLNDIFVDANKKVTSTIDGGKSSKTRTVYLNNDKQNLIRPYYEIEVLEDNKGFSDYDSIRRAIKKFIHDTPDFRTLD